MASFVFVPLKDDQRSNQYHHHHGEQSQFDQGLMKRDFANLWSFGDFRNEDQNPADHGNQGDHQEWLGHKSMLTKRYLNRVKQLNDQAHRKNLVQEIDNLNPEAVCQQRSDKT